MLDIFESLLSSSEATAFEAALASHPRRAIRLRDDFTASSLPFETNPVPWSEQGFFLVDTECRPGAYLDYPAGSYYIQDAGSLLPVTLLNPQPGELICDLCAAPGGKSTAILERMNGHGVLVANEPIRSRTNVLKYMLGRTGLPNYLTTELDPDRMAQEFAGEFDAVLVDAPCSGQMMVSRDKRDSNAWSSRQIEHSAARQQRILDAAIKLLRPGGRLVYSTCTFALEENEKQLFRLLSQTQRGLIPLCCDALKPWESPVQTGCYRLWPHRDFCAGGFAGGILLSDDFEPEMDGGNMRRETAKKSHVPRNLSRHTRMNKKDRSDPVKELETIGVNSCGQIRSINEEAYFGTDEVWALYESHRPIAQPPLVMISSVRRYEPSHTLALARDTWFQPFASISLDNAQAISFLAGESLRGLEQSASQEWTRVMWNGRPIGWGRFSQEQLKNHLPPWARTTGLKTQ
ncbi:MAG: methyltransferase RsmF C-terminal domain-like protein [Pirellula sp.]